MPRLDRYSRTAVARRSPSARLYSAVPMLHVCPSISSRSSGFACSVAIASSSARVASGRSEYRSKSKCTSSNVNSFTAGRITWMLTVAVAVLLSVGHVTVTVTGTVPSCAGAVHAYVTAHPIESRAVAVTVDTLPTSTVHGSHCAVTLRLCCGAGGGGGGGAGGGGGT